MHVKLIGYNINYCDKYQDLDHIDIRLFHQILQHPQISHEQAHHHAESSGPCMQLHPGYQKQRKCLKQNNI